MTNPIIFASLLAGVLLSLNLAAVHCSAGIKGYQPQHQQQREEVRFVSPAKGGRQLQLDAETKTLRQPHQAPLPTRGYEPKVSVAEHRSTSHSVEHSKSSLQQQPQQEQLSLVEAPTKTKLEAPAPIVQTQQKLDLDDKETKGIKREEVRKEVEVTKKHESPAIVSEQVELVSHQEPKERYSATKGDKQSAPASTKGSVAFATSSFSFPLASPDQRQLNPVGKTNIEAPRDLSGKTSAPSKTQERFFEPQQQQQQHEQQEELSQKEEEHLQQQQQQVQQQEEEQAVQQRELYVDAPAPLGMAEPFAFDFKHQDESGNGQYRHEESDKNGVVHGSYGYREAGGQYRHVDYVADRDGFRAKIRSNEPGLVLDESVADSAVRSSVSQIEQHKLAPAAPLTRIVPLASPASAARSATAADITRTTEIKRTGAEVRAAPVATAAVVSTNENGDGFGRDYNDESAAAAPPDYESSHKPERLASRPN